MTDLRVVKSLRSSKRISSRLTSMASEAALVQGYISEDWARVALELPGVTGLHDLAGGFSVFAPDKGQIRLAKKAMKQDYFPRTLSLP